MNPNTLESIADSVIQHPSVLGLLVLVVAAGTSISLGLVWIIHRLSSRSNGFSTMDRQMIAHLDAAAEVMRTCVQRADERLQSCSAELRGLRSDFRAHNRQMESTLANEGWLSQFHCRYTRPQVQEKRER